MSRITIKKKKDSSPYRHIGLALVPPVAFTAVPNSPPPTPIIQRKGKKNKAIMSPIVPAIIAATRTARIIGVGPESSGIEMDRVGISYQSKQQRINDGNHVDEDDMYAEVHYHGDSSSHEGFVEEDGESFLQTDSFVDDSITQVTSKNSHSADVYAIPHKTTHRKKKSKKVRRKIIEEPVVPSTHNMQTFEAPLQREAGDTDHHDNESSKIQDLEERMRLKDEQTREMIFKLMEEKKTLYSKATEEQRSSGFFENTTENLTDENTELADSQLIRDIVEILKGESVFGMEGIVLKQQIQEMVDENEVLKITVHRLNVELSKYQQKYHDNSADLEKISALPENSLPPKWMTDSKYLSPLFLSYDNQLKTQADQIQVYHEKFNELAKQMEVILQENEILQYNNQEKKAEPPVSQERWDNVKDQNNLMVSEIHVLMEQLELMEGKAKEMHKKHIAEVGKLSQRLAITDAELEQSESEKKEVKAALHDLSENHEKLMRESNEKVPPRDHIKAIAHYKNELEDIKEENIKALKETMNKVKEVQKEKSDALHSVVEVNVEKKQLEGEVEALKESRRKLKNHIESLQSDLDASNERELQCQAHLANVVRVAERATLERSTYAAMAEKEQKTSKSALKQTMREKWEMGKMEETLSQNFVLQNCRAKLAFQTQDVDGRLKEVEESHQGHLMEQEREVKHLRKLLQQKQEALEDMAKSKQDIENQLENVWQAASAENRRIMESINKSTFIY